MTLLPELAAALFALWFLAASVAPRAGRSPAVARLLGLGVAAASLTSLHAAGTLFSGCYLVDLSSQLQKAVIAAGLALVTFLFPRDEEVAEGHQAEFWMFLGLSTLGLMMVTSAAELATLVLALEISSFSLYVVIPLRRGQSVTRLEGSIKYLFFGAVATGLMLYGMGYLYGLTGSTRLARIVEVLPGLMHQPLAVAAMLLTLTGVFFKLSLFPFHFWAPDVYESASDTATAFISTVPKVAAAGLLVRLATLAGPGDPRLATGVAIFAGLSMTFGNLAALVQKDLKRMLAYSGIAHAGYLTLGILPMDGPGHAAVLYYALVYVVMNLGCFTVVSILGRRGENVAVEDVAGLARRAPLAGFLLLISALALEGLPPTAGFTAKLFALSAAFRSGHVGVTVLGALNAALSIFYYLNLVRLGYSRPAAEDAPALALSARERALCAVMIAAILYLGLLPFGVLSFIGNAFR